MSGYVTVGALDPIQSNTFYDAVLATVGWAMHIEFPGWRGYSKSGSGKGFVLWVCKPFNGEPASFGNGMMVAFTAGSHDEVDAFHAAAMANGGTDEGAPGPRPNFGPKWYAAYVRDPTGNKIAAVCNE